MNSKINAVKLKQDLTSKTAGIISNSHSLRKLSLLNCGSILVISAIVLAVSDCENTSAKKIILKSHNLGLIVIENHFGEVD